MKLNLDESKSPYTKKYSPYLILAEKICIKKGWFHVDPISKGKIVEPEDMWMAVLMIREYEYRNRKG